MYKWKKTLKKFLIIGGEVLLFGIIAYSRNNMKYLTFIPLLESLRNYLKHRNNKTAQEIIDES